jgi:hypothetical protein
MENIPTFEMMIEDENKDGVFCISLVDSPAIQQDFIMLSKENDKNRIEIKLEKGDLKRQVLTGPALIPNIIIPRKGYNITFSADTIRKISENFLINNRTNSVDLQHKLNVNDVYLVESWIVEDENNDKIYKLGYTPEQVPVGSWCVSMKVKNENLWNEYLQSGVLKGFSIEGSFSEKEIKMKHNDDEDLHNIFLALYFTEDDLDKKFKWKLGPETAERKNCPACKQWAGQVKTLREWINTAIPATPNGTVIAGLTTKYATNPYSTYCEQHCGCELVRVITSKRGATIIKPF